MLDRKRTRPQRELNLSDDRIRVTGAMLYQLIYEAGQFVGFSSVSARERSESKNMYI